MVHFIVSVYPPLLNAFKNFCALRGTLGMPCGATPAVQERPQPCHPVAPPAAGSCPAVWQPDLVLGIPVVWPVQEALSWTLAQHEPCRPQIPVWSSWAAQVASVSHSP